MSTSSGAGLLRGWVRPGEVLAHIGLPKTGTTAVQHAMAAGRPTLREHRISYPGHQLNHYFCGVDLLQVKSRRWPEAGPLATNGEWASLVESVRRAPAGWRHVVSAESLVRADAVQVDRVVRDLGAVRVVVGVRPLQSLLPSLWQEWVKSGFDVTFDDWLTDVVESSTDDSSSTFGPVPALEIDRVVDRWASRVGVDNVAVVVVSDVGRAQLDVFEAMLALDPGTLQLSTEPISGNRGLTAEEVDMLWRFNTRLDRSTVTLADYQWASRAMSQFIQARPPRGSKLVLPPWAVPVVQRIAESQVEVLMRSGVHIVGDLGDLLPATATDSPESPRYDRDIEIEVGVDMMLAFLAAHVTERTQPVHPLKRWLPPVLLGPARRVRSLLPFRPRAV